MNINELLSNVSKMEGSFAVAYASTFSFLIMRNIHLSTLARSIGEILINYQMDEKLSEAENKHIIENKKEQMRMFIKRYKITGYLGAIPLLLICPIFLTFKLIDESDINVRFFLLILIFIFYVMGIFVLARDLVVGKQTLEKHFEIINIMVK